MALVAPSAASAESFYAAVRGGPGVTPDTRSGLPGSEDVQEFGTGFTGSAALGYVLPFGLRLEGELGYLYSPLKSDGGVSVDGSIKSYLGMANVYYDLKLPVLGAFKPYVGFGIGAASVNDDHEVFASTLGAKFEVDEWRTAFAYQARVGVGYDVNKWLDLSLGYRYVHIDSGHEQNQGGPRINLGPIENHSIELGAAIKF
jgi:opacity protein-like surface antigen